jgi:hypothetical protein
MPSPQAGIWPGSYSLYGSTADVMTQLPDYLHYLLVE